MTNNNEKRGVTNQQNLISEYEYMNPKTLNNELVFSPMSAMKRDANTCSSI